MSPGRLPLALVAIVSLAIAGQAIAGPNANAVSLDLIADGGGGNRADDGVIHGTASGDGQTIAIEVFATGVTTSLIGFVLKFDFDASLVSFVRAENSAFALTLPEGSIGANFASGTPVTLSPSGFLARAEFETIADVTGREFSIGFDTVTLAESTTSSDVLVTTRVITFNAAPSGADGSDVLSLDLIPGGGAGNQVDDRVTSGTVAGTGTTVAMEVFAASVRTPLVGMILKFDFDASLLAFVNAENSAFPLTLPEGSVGINFASGVPVTLAPSGFLARAEFETIADVTGREFSIGIETVTLAENTTSREVLSTRNAITFNAIASPDFDGDGTVGFSDFVQFASRFGEQQGDSGFDARFDLDGDGRIGFSDFLIFARNFGREIPSSGGASPDLVIAALTVSDNAPTPGQPFTLDVTVRNRGDGPAGSTSLRYYSSPNATISTNDTEVGTVTLRELAASGTRDASIGLTAPSSAGVYYYGACVDAVTGESDTGNNCSRGVSVTVAPSPFRIEVVFVESASRGGYNASQKALFHKAAARWMSIITGDIPDSDFSDRPIDRWDDLLGARIFVDDTVDDLRIFVGIGDIDGARGTLGRGGTRIVRRNRNQGTLVTKIGAIAIDGDDLEWMSETLLSGVILHEMGHVLGFGTVWETLDLVRGERDVYFTGPRAIRAFDDAGGLNYSGPKVPAESDSSHWRGSVFGDELMTATFRTDLAGSVALSRITIQSLADHGYQVDVGQADEYRLPAPASAKPVAEHLMHWGDCIAEGPIYVVDEKGRIVDVLGRHE
ncbi:MAG: hypothetical protein OXU79_00435 [Gemmatimonadota bacterium]|nr:hypothetical protein [Gemmatimonadota bacterium]